MAFARMADGDPAGTSWNQRLLCPTAVKSLYTTHFIFVLFLVTGVAVTVLPVPFQRNETFSPQTVSTVSVQ